MTWDDPEYIIPIGFEFDFFDISINELYFYGLGAALTNTFAPAGIFPLLVPFGSDIIDRAYDMDIYEPTPESLSNISYKLEGLEGSRILKIEWNNVGFYYEYEENEESNDFANFQFWLYEGSNNFEIHFGESSINYPALSFDEESGPLVVFEPELDEFEDVLSENAMVLNGDPASPNFSVGPIDIEDAYLDGMVPNGTIYRFIKSTSSTRNQIAPNISMKVFPNPAVDLMNFSIIDVAMEISSLAIVSMSGQEIFNIAFPSSPIDISFLHPGIYIIEFYTKDGVACKKLIKK